MRVRPCECEPGARNHHQADTRGETNWQVTQPNQRKSDADQR